MIIFPVFLIKTRVLFLLNDIPRPSHALPWPCHGLATMALALDLAWPGHCHAFGPRVQWPAIPCLSCTFGFSLLGQGKAGYTFGFSFLGQGRAGYTFCLGPALRWSWSWTWPWTPHCMALALLCLALAVVGLSSLSLAKARQAILLAWTRPRRWPSLERRSARRWSRGGSHW